MLLVDIPVRDQDFLELARLLRDAGFDKTAETIEDAYDVEYCASLSYGVASAGSGVSRGALTTTPNAHTLNV